MAENRRSILSNLETALGNVSGVNTVLRFYTNLDVTQYTEAELPLIAVKEPGEENDTEMTGRRAMVSIDLMIRLYFVTWGINPTSTYETLVKNIRDEIGEDFHLNNKSVATWVTSVSDIDGDMPLYSVDIGLRCLYYQNQQAT